MFQELHASLENSNLDARELENARAGQVCNTATSFAIMYDVESRLS